MDSQKSTSLVTRSTDAELMPPPPKRIKRPKNVIDEESYTKAVSEIIARDFFPGLLESEVKQEYLDALESQNEAWISSAQRRLKHVMTSGRRFGRRGTSIPYHLPDPNIPKNSMTDTPATVSSSANPKNKLKTLAIDKNMSLDAFQSKYTTEDNESFYKLLDDQNKKRAEKYAWMWSSHNKLPSKMMLKQKEIEVKLLQSRGTLEDDGGKRDRLAIRDASEMPAKTRVSKPKNQLMFVPDSVEDTVQTVAGRAQAESKAAPKSVSYENTRIPVPSEACGEDNTTIPPSPSLSAVKHAISGKRLIPESESGFDGGETPLFHGYSFVDDEPDEEPSRITKTINLGKGDLTKSPFIIKAQSSREDLLHRIVDRNARNKRQSANSGFTGKIQQTPVPRFPSSPRVRSTQLTPAAQRLWSQVGRSGLETPHAFGSTRPKSGLHSDWTAK